MPRFGGPATMMRLPAGGDGPVDVGFVGVPFDIGTSHRSGARFGPRAIRAESALLRPYNMATRAAPFASLLAPGSVTIPVWVHVIRASDGSGDVSDQQIFQQIDVLNGAFAGQQGFGSGADTPFRFQLADATRTDNSDWFNLTPGSPQETG